MDAESANTISATPSGNSGGCFGTGYGKLDLPSNQCTFKPNLGKMKVGETCNITVIVSKEGGARKGVVSTLIEVTDGAPPGVDVR